MDMLQIFLQIVFSLIVVAVGLFCGKWLCLISPEEIKKGKKWAKILIKVFVFLLFLSIISGFFIGWNNALFVFVFLVFLISMMFGVIIFKEEDK